jgi:orotidine-5'-phosphate decarboxylase
MDRKLTLAERLIVPADFSSGGEYGVARITDKVMALAMRLEGTGVTIKINSAARTCGHSLVKVLHNLGVKVMHDLKLNDIPQTMQTDAEIIAEFKPELLTVMCSAGVEGMSRVQKTLEGITEVLGVTVLTSLDEEGCSSIYGASPEVVVGRLALLAYKANLGGLVASGAELKTLRNTEWLDDLSLNIPGIRPTWSVVPGDDQSRVMTPRAAIMAGADRIIVGRPILNAKPNDDGLPNNPREAVERTLTEIEEALASLATAPVSFPEDKDQSASWRFFSSGQPTK